MRPGHVERREFEYSRHGTQTLIANTEDLKQQMLEFIGYFNEKLAHPFQWTFKGELLPV